MQTIALILPRVKQEFGLAEDVAGIIPSIEFAGMFVGALFWGWLSDVIGRQKAFFYTLVVGALFGLSSAFSPNWIFLTICLFVMGFGIGGNLPIDGAMLAEFLPKERRGAILSFLSIFWVLGSVYSASFAWLLLPRLSCENGALECGMWENRGWRCLVLTMGVTNALMFALRLGCPPSPRWLLLNSRTEEAERVLQKMALSNKRTHSLEQTNYPPSLKLVLYKPDNSSPHCHSLTLDATEKEEFEEKEIAIEEKEIEIEEKEIGIEETEKGENIPLLYSKRKSNYNCTAAPPSSREGEGGDVGKKGALSKSLRELFTRKYAFLLTILMIVWIATNYAFTTFNLFLPQLLQEKGVKSLDDVYRTV